MQARIRGRDFRGHGLARHRVRSRVRRQSDHVDDYDRALESLRGAGARLSLRLHARRDRARRPRQARSRRRAAACGRWCRGGERARRRGETAAMRLDMARARRLAPAKLEWREFGEGVEERRVEATPEAWGDVVLRGKERPASLSPGGGRRRRAARRQRRRARPRSFPLDVGASAAAGAARAPGAALSPPPPRARASGEKMSKSRGSRSLAELRGDGLQRRRGARRAGFRRRRRRAAPRSPSVDLGVGAGLRARRSPAVALGACAINWSMRSRSRLKAASMRPSNSRVRASLIAIGSTKLPLMMTS